MNATITSTTTAGVSRKLSNLGFERYRSTIGLGFLVHKDLGSILVANHTTRPGTAAMELEDAGYIIEKQGTSECLVTGRHIEIFSVIGRVAA